MVQPRKCLPGLVIVRPGLDPQGPLPHGRQGQLQRQDLGDLPLEPEPPEPRLGQDDGVVIALVQLAEPGVDVSAKVAHFEVAAGVEQLGPAAEAAGPNHRADGKPLERPGPVRDQHVVDRGPLGHGRQAQTRHHVGRQVLQAVDGQVDAALEQLPLDFLREKAAVGSRTDRVLPAIAGGRDLDHLHLDAQLPKPGRNPVGLPSGQRAGPGAKTQSYG